MKQKKREEEEAVGFDMRIQVVLSRMLKLAKCVTLIVTSRLEPDQYELYMLSIFAAKIKP